MTKKSHPDQTALLLIAVIHKRSYFEGEHRSKKTFAGRILVLRQMKQRMKVLSSRDQLARHQRSLLIVII
jgi:hypothetical protein